VKLVVMIPAYNEEKSIAEVISEIPRQVEGVSSVKVLVINDGSTDGTVREAEHAGADKIVGHGTNKGLGATFKDGLDAALDMGADVIVNIDADGQYNATEIPRLIQPILEDKADFVLGWRDIDKLAFMPRGKRIGNKTATWVTRRFCHLPIKDAQSGFRAFSRDTAMKLNLSGRYTYVQETLIQASYKGLRIEQVPIEFRARKGQSRLISNIGAYARRAGVTIISTYWNYNPLVVFGLISGVLVVAGLVFAMRVLIHFIQVGHVAPLIPSSILATLLIVAGLVTFVLGILADTSKNQRMLQEEILYRLKKHSLPPQIDGE
jgi:glycosyltransferase involved in cell wall biosynthesis